MRRKRRVLRWSEGRDGEDKTQAELDSELDFHFERTIAALVGEGLPRDAAEKEARRRFGDEALYRRELIKVEQRHASRQRKIAFLNSISQTFVYAMRSIRRSPGFTAAVVVTFGLGIGANATMFGLVDRLLLRPPSHVRDHDRVRRLYVNSTLLGSPTTIDWLSIPDYQDLLSSQSLAAVAAYSPVEMTLGSGETTTRVRATIATASFFPLLQVQPLLGRFFTPEEDQLGSSGVAVVGHAFWQQQLGGDREVLGRMLHVGNGVYTVIGIAPKGFTGVELAPVDVWLPLHVAADRIYDSDRWLTSRDWWFFKAVARMRNSVAAASAEAEVSEVYRRARAERSDYDPHSSITLASLVAARAPNAPSETIVTRWLAGVSAMVLLIACANVMNLLLARGIRWRREFAVRIALGISRARLFGQLVTEGLLLAVLGGGVALLFAVLGANLMRNTLVPDVLWSESPVNMRVFLFTMGISVAVGVVASLAPAMRSTRQDPGGALKEDQRSSGVRRSKTQTALLLSQSAFAVLLLVGAGLFVRSMQRVQSLDHGMDVENVLVVGLEFNATSVGFEDAVDVYTRAVENMNRVPGVEHAAAVSVIPFHGTYSVSLSVPGMDSLPVPPNTIHAHSVTAGYFATLGVTIVRGRGFEASDVRHSQRVVVVNETMADLFWPNENAIGRCLIIGRGEPPCAEIVGIVSDMRERDATADPGPQFYGLLEQGVQVGMPRAVLVRYAAHIGSLRQTVHRTALLTDPGIRAANTMLLSDLIDPQLRSWRLGATMFTVFGGLALVVATIGLYSILAFDIESRTHELGIRSALGASGRKLIIMVFRQAVGLTATAVMIGLCTSFAAGRAIESMLFEVSPRDPLVFATVAITMLAVAVLAAWIPATRAARIDPNEALRVE